MRNVKTTNLSFFSIWAGTLAMVGVILWATTPSVEAAGNVEKPPTWTLKQVPDVASGCPDLLLSDLPVEWFEISELTDEQRMVALTEPVEAPTQESLERRLRCVLSLGTRLAAKEAAETVE